MNNKKITILLSIIIFLLCLIIILLIINNKQIDKKNSINENKIEEEKKNEPSQNSLEENNETSQNNIENNTEKNTESVDSSKKENQIIEKDKIILKEFENIEKETDECINNKKLSDKITDKVATMIGFIWYDEEINGIKYKELKEETKEKLLNIYYKIDGKIESKNPNYKEKIKDKYSIISKFMKDKYDDFKYDKDIFLKETLKDKYNDYIKVKEALKEKQEETKGKINTKKEEYNEKIKNWYIKKKSE